MKILLWRGFHSKELLALLEDAFLEKSVLILCPPHLKEYKFLNFLPKGDVQLVGEWSDEEKSLALLSASSRNFVDYDRLPHVGVFSSGTMSFTPSLILFRKEQTEHSLQSILELFSDKWAEKIICYPQPFHIFGLTLGYIHSLLWKKPLLIPPGRYHKSFHDVWLREDRKGLLSLGAPVHFYDLLHRIPEDQKIVSSSSICGGARVSPELWKSFQSKLGIEFPSIGYGATEACPGITHLPPGVVPQENGDIGYWLKGIEAKKLSHGFEFKGPNTCLAIIEEVSKDNFQIRFPQSILIKDELDFRGDRIIYVGRSDLKLNRGGEKYSLEIIEEKLSQELGVSVLAVALPDDRLGEKLGLCLQSRGDSTQLRGRCKDIVARDFAWVIQSQEMRVLDQLPLNTNGKWDRRKARESLLIEKSGRKNDLLEEM